MHSVHICPLTGQFITPHQRGNGPQDSRIGECDNRIITRGANSNPLTGYYIPPHEQENGIQDGGADVRDRRTQRGSGNHGTGGQAR